MVSQKKIEANRENAKKSTGPRTKRGLDLAGLNPLKHGVFSRAGLLLGEYKDWEKIMASFAKRNPPEDEIEMMYLSEIASEMLRLKRIATAEEWYFTQKILDEQPTAGGLAATKVLIKALIEDHGFVPENVDRQRRRSISNIERDLKAWEAYRRRRTIEVDCEARPVIDAAPVERRLLAAPEPETGPALESKKTKPKTGYVTEA